MKIRTWTVGIAVLMFGAVRAAAGADTSGWSYDNNVKGVAFASDCCEPACGAKDNCCSDSCCGEDKGCGDKCGCGDDCGKGGICGAIEGCSLKGALGVCDKSPLILNGWSQWGYTNRNDGVFNTHPNHFDPQQQYMIIGWKADGSNGLGIGGQVDCLYGTDGSNTQAFGNPFGTWDFQNGWDHGVDGWALPQCYGELAMGDLDVKIGHFYTTLGYEVVPATGNFFYSHAYTMNFDEPFTHTGVLGSYKAGDKLTVNGGWVLGWDTGFDNLNSGNGVLGGFTYTIADGVTFAYQSVYGNFGWRDSGSTNSYVQSCVFIAGITDKLQYVAQSDTMRTDNPGVSQADAVGINQYLFYTLTDVFKLGARIEWWKSDGTSFYEMAYGVNIKPIKNFLFRPEIRYNWCPAATSTTVPPNNFIPVVDFPIPTGNATQPSDYKNNTIVGMDCIYSF